MCTQGQCASSLGQWVSFRSPWGVHRGIVAGVNQRAVLMKVPWRYAPMGLATHPGDGQSDEDRLNLTLAQYGYGGYPGYGGYAYGRRWGYPGYGAWGGGWLWWWLAFA